MNLTQEWIIKMNEIERGLNDLIPPDDPFELDEIMLFEIMTGRIKPDDNQEINLQRIKRFPTKS